MKKREIFSEKKIFFGNVNIRNFPKMSKQEFLFAKQEIFSEFQKNRFIDEVSKQVNEKTILRNELTSRSKYLNSTNNYVIFS